MVSDSGGGTCLNNPPDRYARNMTSFSVHHDVTMATCDVNGKCDARDDKKLVFADGHYRYSPASLQVASRF